MPLTGTHHVRILRSALQTGHRLWPAVGDRMELKRQAMKLRFWGDRSSEAPAVLDLDYESIKAMHGERVYELRLADEIGGHRNIRVIFFDPPRSCVPNFQSPLPVLWILDVVPKKRDEWTQFDIDRFGAKVEIVRQRFCL